jgi:hypothetical protein
MIMGSRQHGARFGTALANTGDLNMDGYEGRKYKYRQKFQGNVNINGHFLA